MMTEEQAKTKTCPLSMNASNRGPCDCIASQCMAWKWAKHTKTRRAVYAEAEDIPGARLGGCGMAGRPE